MRAFAFDQTRSTRFGWSITLEAKLTASNACCSMRMLLYYCEIVHAYDVAFVQTQIQFGVVSFALLFPHELMEE